MADQSMREVFARLERQELELTALRGEVIHLREKVSTTQRARRRPPIRPRWSGRLGAALVLALLVASVPVGLLATDRYPDVPATYFHHDDINLIADAGVTRVPANGEPYRPRDNVTRGEMASFLARTAGLGANPPVVNAATALTAASANTATNAGNADTLDGKSANELVRVASREGYFPTLPSSFPSTVLEVTITAPGPGFVLVISKGQATTTATTGCPCQVFTGIVRAGEGAAYAFTLNNASADEVSAIAAPAQEVFTIEGAGPQTFQLTMSQASGSAVVSGHATLTAIYIPFGSTGAGTLGDIGNQRPPSGAGVVRR